MIKPTLVIGQKYVHIGGWQYFTNGKTYVIQGFEQSGDHPVFVNDLDQRVVWGRYDLTCNSPSAYWKLAPAPRRVLPDWF
jgi:hypothetical protein